MSSIIRPAGIATLLALFLVDAAAAVAVSKRQAQTFTVSAGKTRMLEVPFPDALEFGGSSYSGEVKILEPARGVHGARPVLSKVKVLSEGSIEGGSLYGVTVRNSNPLRTAAVRVQVIAITVESGRN